MTCPLASFGFLILVDRETRRGGDHGISKLADLFAGCGDRNVVFRADHPLALSEPETTCFR